MPVGYYRFGEVAEWLNATAVLAFVDCPRSEVRIPPSPAILGGSPSRFVFRSIFSLRGVLELTIPSFLALNRSSSVCGQKLPLPKDSLAS